MSTEDEVRTASEQFYAALNKMANGDASAMSEIWSHDTVVTAMHPVGGRHVGWDEVRDSFNKWPRSPRRGG
jgi:SnoaL-like domain